ncbi:unnamed protein product [Cyclocybe aegerita]|uniref:Uncharacterized protein n=1 Tax=Cyclocybe aegerita TaxID=1973307 RepID=A0A8S0X2G9_CYCAE|nr:unnamed protein product [Cyclocybe aegerita]
MIFDLFHFVSTSARAMWSHSELERISFQIRRPEIMEPPANKVTESIANWSQSVTLDLLLRREPIRTRQSTTGKLSRNYTPTALNTPPFNANSDPGASSDSQTPHTHPSLDATHSAKMLDTTCSTFSHRMFYLNKSSGSKNSDCDEQTRRGEQSGRGGHESDSPLDCMVMTCA